LSLQTAKVLEKDRYDMSPDDIKQYFETLSVQIWSILFAFVWDVDDTRVRYPKKTSPPEVIIAIIIKPGSVTIPEVRDDAQLTLLTAISAFGILPVLYYFKTKDVRENVPCRPKAVRRS
jgi:hypothetical protein